MLNYAYISCYLFGVPAGRGCKNGSLCYPLHNTTVLHLQYNMD
jgi:hypothetical protein